MGLAWAEEAFQPGLWKARKGSVPDSQDFKEGRCLLDVYQPAGSERFSFLTGNKPSQGGLFHSPALPETPGESVTGFQGEINDYLIKAG